MQITITNVLKNEVTVSGQTMSREYVETIMLPLLMAQWAETTAPSSALSKLSMKLVCPLRPSLRTLRFTS